MAEVKGTQAATASKKKFADLRQAAAKLQEIAGEIGTGQYRASILHFAAAIAETVPVLIRKYQQLQRIRNKKPKPTDDQEHDEAETIRLAGNLKALVEASGNYVDSLRDTVEEMLDDQTAVGFEHLIGPEPNEADAERAEREIEPLRTRLDAACNAFDNALGALLR